MTLPTLTPTRFENGIWQGHVTSPDKPDLTAWYRGAQIDDIALTQAENGWDLRISVPIAALSDGVHSIVISDRPTGTRIGDFSIIAGSVADGDLMAQLELLRSELDMLKRAFRRIHQGD